MSKKVGANQVTAEGGESLAAKSGFALRKVSRNHAHMQVIVTESGTT